MCRWRDCVINAFNADMPFDQFTIEQLAGDLLLNPTAEQFIATAFNRNHIITEETGVFWEKHRVELRRRPRPHDVGCLDRPDGGRCTVPLRACEHFVDHDFKLCRFSAISFNSPLCGSANFCKPSDISVSSSFVKSTSRSISATTSADGN